MNATINFLKFRKQWIILNGQVSQWTNLEARVSQGSIPWPLLLFIYINEFFDAVLTNARLSAENTSLLLLACDINTSTTHLINDLRKSSNWPFQWKTCFNLSPVNSEQQLILPITKQQFNQASLVSKTSENDFRHQIKFSRPY